MARLYNLARMHTATLGSVALIDLGDAVTGFLSFANAGVTDGITVSYSINDPRGGGSEVGSGVYHSSGPSFTRTTVEKSSDGTSRISLSVNAEIMISPSAYDLNKLYGVTIATADNVAIRWDSVNQVFQDSLVVIADDGSISGAPNLTDDQIVLKSQVYS